MGYIQMFEARHQSAMTRLWPQQRSGAISPAGKTWVIAAVSTLRPVGAASDQFQPKLKRILEAVAAVTGLPLADVRGPRRQRNLIHARMVFYWLARETGASYPQIGKACGYRDHTTIMSGLDKVAVNLASMQETIDAVRELLGREV